MVKNDLIPIRAYFCPFCIQINLPEAKKLVNKILSTKDDNDINTHVIYVLNDLYIFLTVFEIKYNLHSISKNSNEWTVKDYETFLNMFHYYTLSSNKKGIHEYTDCRAKVIIQRNNDSNDSNDSNNRKSIYFINKNGWLYEISTKPKNLPYYELRLTSEESNNNKPLIIWKVLLHTPDAILCLFNGDYVWKPIII